MVSEMIVNLQTSIRITIEDHFLPKITQQKHWFKLLNIELIYWSKLMFCVDFNLMEHCKLLFIKVFEKNCRFRFAPMSSCFYFFLTSGENELFVAVHILQWRNDILLPKLFWPTVRKKCSTDREKLLKFEAEGRKFANFWDY